MALEVSEYFGQTPYSTCGTRMLCECLCMCKSVSKGRQASSVWANLAVPPVLNRTFVGRTIDALSNDLPPRGLSCCLGGRLCQGSSSKVHEGARQSKGRQGRAVVYSICAPVSMPSPFKLGEQRVAALGSWKSCRPFWH